MTNTRTSRLSAAVAVSLVVVIGQITALAAIGFHTAQDLFSPTSSTIRFPMVPYAQLFQGQIVVPILGMTATKSSIQFRNLICLRCVDLQTGRSRDIDLVSPNDPSGLITNGTRLWCVVGNEIFEFDGTDVVSIRPKHALATQISFPFIYQGSPAIVEQSSDGKYRLMSLVDNDWQDQGQIALPGTNRTWSVDPQSGESILVPRTSESTPGVSGRVHLKVVEGDGQYHLLQSDTAPSLCYRVGFDFVRSEDSDSISALAPENAPAETTGWVQLDKNLISFFGAALVHHGELILANDKEIWRHTGDDREVASSEFESLMQLDVPDDMGLVSVVSNRDTDDLYLLKAPILGDVEVFRLQGAELQKTSIQIEGFGRPLARWLGRTLLQIIAVLCCGTLILVVAASWLGGISVYSFGLESVELGPMLRRACARGLDMSLILGPPTFYCLWLARNATLESFVDGLSRDDMGLSDLFPAAGWAGLAWLALIISTGVWGASPGKWLFGQRVVRTTLRPCGIVFALLRELLFWFDAPLLLTVVPGVSCILATAHRQRVGDLISGTLVIQAPKSDSVLLKRSLEKNTAAIDGTSKD